MNRRESRRQAKKAKGRVNRDKIISHNFLDEQIDEAVGHHRAGRLHEAEKIYRRVLDADPKQPQALCMLGTIASATGNNEQALDLISRAIAAKPDYATAHANLGVVLLTMGSNEKALESLNHALAYNPEDTAALNNKGAALVGSNQLEEAVACYDKSIKISPDTAMTHYNLGNVFYKLRRVNEAIAEFQKAIEIKPDFVEAHNNLGNLYRDMGRMKEAVQTYQNSIAKNPDYAETHLNLSFALLSSDRIDEGLDEYEWRWQSSSCTTPWRDFVQPHWDGVVGLNEKTILVWPEQGLGDTIIWASCLEEIISRAGHCIIQVYPKLFSLFVRSFPDAVLKADHGPEDIGHEVAHSENFDFHLSMASLFRALGSAQTCAVPAFLVADPDRIAFWKKRLADLGPGPYVGISWKSPVVNPDRSSNYTRIEEWSPLFALPAQFINLQCGDTGDDLAWAERQTGVTVHDFDDIDLFNDLDDVAALIAALDLGIAVNTAVAKISAAIGTPTWVIAWRQSPWSNFLLSPRGPEVTRFERDTGESWNAVFASMAGQLRNMTE